MEDFPKSDRVAGCPALVAPASLPISSDEGGGVDKWTVVQLAPVILYHHIRNTYIPYQIWARTSKVEFYWRDMLSR